ncbi:uncharacterized protein LOC111637139 [Centruroides sculpturatus]|uniref:uncharacterized protein LOC111637139 n=1 Tax=Centruroides sculpturatus TaxID=218467 RepID=UPI000C6E676C|nr:uncharacterized protein LOC111637139 [Centruroides sculpturatus]
MSVKLPEYGKIRKGKSLNICVICDNIAHTNKYENWTCTSCAEFFVSCVKMKVTPACQKYGKCECSFTVTEKCDFCYLNKCYCFGLKSYLVEGFDMNSIENVIGTQYEREDKEFLHYNSFIKSIYILEQQFYQWMAHLQKYCSRSMTMITRNHLEQKHLKRGIIAGFIERCVNVHNVIRLHDCFIDWKSSDCLFMRHFFLNVLRFTNSIRRFYASHQNFYSLLLKLIFKEDIRFYQCEPGTENFSILFTELECWFSSCAEKNKIVFNEKIVDTYDFDINIYKFKKALQCSAFPKFEIVVQ